MSSAVSSHGTLFKIGDGGGGGEVFTTIAEVLDISGPGITVRTEDVTNHDSVAWAEHKPTIKELGEATFDLNYFSAVTQDTLRTDMLAMTIRNFQVVFKIFGGTETWAFAGIITGWAPNATVAGIMRASITIKGTGALTVT